MNTTTPVNDSRSFLGKIRILLAVACLTVAGLAAPASVTAGEYRHYQANAAIFGDWDLAKGLMTMAHMTAELRSVEFDRVSSVVDSQGNTKAGAYALCYDFNWKSSFDDSSNTTHFIFFFNSSGYLTEIQAKTPGAFFPPFSASTLTANLLIEWIKEEIRNNGTQADRAIFNTIVQSGDTKEMMTFLLKLHQRGKLP
ncbi:MAG: hypothetical protein ACAI34_19150 [Verrucomicrobium sp.]|nr:hypothetical protein [Verrucomicrobium sp.]